MVKKVRSKAGNVSIEGVTPSTLLLMLTGMAVASMKNSKDPAIKEKYLDVATEHTRWFHGIEDPVPMSRRARAEAAIAKCKGRIMRVGGVQLGMDLKKPFIPANHVAKFEAWCGASPGFVSRIVERTRINEAKERQEQARYAELNPENLAKLNAQ